MISLLASVRDLVEAREAAAAGVDLIDLKEPSAGALGALATDDIREIVTAIRSGWPHRPVSATIGDFAADDHAGRRTQAAVVARCGVDYVKAGIEPGEHALTALRDLADLHLPSIVIVFLADRGIDLPLVQAAASMGFAGVMVDTADKSSGSLLRRADPQALRNLVAVARLNGCLSGVAGSLGLADVGMLRQLAPDFAGFRGALCDVDRRGRLDAAKVRALRAALRADEGRDRLQSSPANDLRIRASSFLPSNSIG